MNNHRDATILDEINRESKRLLGLHNFAQGLMRDLCDNTDLDCDVLDLCYYNYGTRGLEAIERHEFGYAPQEFDAAIMIAILADVVRFV